MRGVVAADRAWKGVVGPCRAHERTNARDGVLACQGDRDERRRRDEGEQYREERLVNVHGVVSARQRLIGVQHLHADDLQTLGLEAAQDFTDERSLHGVGLQEN